MVQSPPSSASSVPAASTDVRLLVDAALARYVDFGDGCPVRLAEAIRYSLLAPGKRLRPELVLRAAAVCGCRLERALPAACAVEMVHAYSLIHDDLPAMDDDPVRRGRPSCHVAFDEATAILAGDALLARAFEILAQEVQPPEVAACCCAELARAAGATALVGGQADDLATESAGVGIAQLESIHRRKTGAMLVASLRLGARIAGATRREMECLSQFGEKLGLAFQIVDDLLDYRDGDAQPKDSTIHGAKLAFPQLIGQEASQRRASDLVQEACAALAPLGDRAKPLEELAHYVLARDH
jgi:geranylgeranyl diphosphate synthase type II